jgi:hypothetical protein
VGWSYTSRVVVSDTPTQQRKRDATNVAAILGGSCNGLRKKSPDRKTKVAGHPSSPPDPLNLSSSSANNTLKLVSDP